MASLPPYVSQEDVVAFVRRALSEDVGDGDVTSAATVGAHVHAEAALTAKEGGILAGTYVCESVFRQLAPGFAVDWHRTDGDAVVAGDRVATMRGPARALLTGERTALNVLQRMSGIATSVGAMVAAVRPHSAEILDTRKTAPGMRALDKWAVLVGGGRNHRLGLFDMILIKENHITAAGGIAPAIRAARAWTKTHGSMAIEIEARTLDEVREVLAIGGVDMILLDNMACSTTAGLDTSLLTEAVVLVDGRHKTEASGNVTLETVNAIAATGVDFISSGALTHSVRALDLSLVIHLVP